MSHKRKHEPKAHKTEKPQIRLIAPVKHVEEPELDSRPEFETLGQETTPEAIQAPPPVLEILPQPPSEPMLPEPAFSEPMLPDPALLESPEPAPMRAVAMVEEPEPVTPPMAPPRSRTRSLPFLLGARVMRRWGQATGRGSATCSR